MIHVVSVRRDKLRHSNGYGHGREREEGRRWWVDEGKMWGELVRVGRNQGVELVAKEIGGVRSRDG